MNWPHNSSAQFHSNGLVQSILDQLPWGLSDGVGKRRVRVDHEMIVNILLFFYTIIHFPIWISHVFPSSPHLWCPLFHHCLYTLPLVVFDVIKAVPTLTTCLSPSSVPLAAFHSFIVGVEEGHSYMTSTMRQWVEPEATTPKLHPHTNVLSGWYDDDEREYHGSYYQLRLQCDNNKWWLQNKDHDFEHTEDDDYGPGLEWEEETWEKKGWGDGKGPRYTCGLGEHHFYFRHWHHPSIPIPNLPSAWVLAPW